MNLCYGMDAWTDAADRLGGLSDQVLGRFGEHVGEQIALGGSNCQICMWYNYNCKLAENRRLHTISAERPGFRLEGQHISR